MKRLISILISLVLLVHIAPAVSAKPKGDWESVKALAHQTVAVKTRAGGVTHYGLVDAVDDTVITIQLAGRDDMTSQRVNVKRNDVEKVWRATLRFEDNVKKATLIGAGLGLGVSFIVVGVLASQNEPSPPHGAALFPLIGAGAGAIAGRFWKKKHQKLDLVYSI